MFACFSKQAGFDLIFGMDKIRKKDVFFLVNDTTFLSFLNGLIYTTILLHSKQQRVLHLTLS